MSRHAGPQDGIGTGDAASVERPPSADLRARMRRALAAPNGAEADETMRRLQTLMAQAMSTTPKSKSESAMKQDIVTRAVQAAFQLGQLTYAKALLSRELDLPRGLPTEPEQGKEPEANDVTFGP